MLKGKGESHPGRTLDEYLWSRSHIKTIYGPCWPGVTPCSAAWSEGELKRLLNFITTNIDLHYNTEDDLGPNHPTTTPQSQSQRLILLLQMQEERKQHEKWSEVSIHYETLLTQLVEAHSEEITEE